MIITLRCGQWQSLPSIYMKNNLLTITVCIPAHNEVENIGNLLTTILRQKLTHGKLDRVLVLCDGCTDSTVTVAKKIANKHQVISVIDDGNRLGKHRRLLNAFRTCTTDIVVVFDGDTLLTHELVLEELLLPFKDASISLVGGNNIPVSDSGVENYLINAWTLFWFGVKQYIRKGIHIHNVRSCCLAMRRGLIHNLVWPEQLQSHGQFLYLEALRTKTRFMFASKATVWYRNPTTFADYAIQKKRGVGKWKDFAKRFGPWVSAEYHITRMEKAQALLYIFIRHPITTIIAGIFRVFLIVYFKHKVDSASSHFWTIAQTTKKGISLDLFDTKSAFFTL